MDSHGPTVKRRCAVEPAGIGLGRKNFEGDTGGPFGRVVFCIGTTATREDPKKQQTVEKKYDD